MRYPSAIKNALDVPPEGYSSGMSFGPPFTIMFTGRFYMKKCAYLVMIALLLVPSCKKEKKFVEPDYIFAKWAKSIESLNYTDYTACEAIPKSEGVFREIYRDTYYADLMVTEVEKANEKRILKDNKGRSYIKRNVQFECTEIRRRDRKHVRLLRGDVDFIRYTDGGKERRGWLMWNRKIIRIDR